MTRNRKLLIFIQSLGISILLVSQSVAASTFSNTQDVFSHFQIPAEADPSHDLGALQELQTAAGLQKILPILDPRGFFGRFSTTDIFDSKLNLFQDIDAKSVSDFSVDLAKTQGRVSSFETRLRTAVAVNSTSLPLKGLRIALDPGHMGSAFWDKETGKYVKSADGKIVSEGVINLETVLLLEKELNLLGAETMVTHRSLAPVSKMLMADLPLHQFGLGELRESSLLSWFQTLLSSTPLESKLFAAFEDNSNFKQLFSESRRSPYFITIEDLRARAEVINAFSPDLTLIIHYDTMDPPGGGAGVNPHDWDRTKTYVNGTYALDEFSSREDRKFFVNHLLNPFAWDTSRELARTIVHQLHDKLALPYDVTGGGDSLEIEPGIFARNLSLNRQISGHAVTYIEVLHYNDPAEFALLSSGTHPFSIDGVNYPYSDRLMTAVQAIKSGVVDFMASDYLHPH